MKKFSIILAAMLLIGGILLSVGLALGGATEMLYSNNKFVFETEDDVEMVTEIIENKIKNIEMNIDLSKKVSIIAGDNFSVCYDKAKYNVEISENTLTIEQLNKKTDMIIGFNYHTDFEAITVTVPKSLNFESLNLNLDMNELEIEDISANNLEMYVDVGNVKIQNCYFNNMNVETDIGDIKIYNSKIQNQLNATANIGDVDLNDCELKNAEFLIDIGNLNLDLVGNEEDFTIETQVDIGTFKIDGIKSDANRVLGDGDNKIKIEVDTGNCNLDFVR